MTDWICPNCRGGFETAVLDDGACPWCGQVINGSYEPEGQVKTSIVRNDDDEHRGIFHEIFY